MSIENQNPITPEAPAMIEMPESIKRSLGDSALEPRAGGTEYVKPAPVNIEADAFKGDTSKVIGHPDNITGQMTDAYAKELDEREYKI